MIQEVSKQTPREFNFMPKTRFLFVVIASLVIGLALTASAADSAKKILKRSTVSTTSNAATAQPGPATLMHYAPNANVDSIGNYVPGKAGFNLADVRSISRLNSLPAGVKGLVDVGQCNGADAVFISTVQRFIGNPKLFGFYLMDDPDPTGKYHPLCTADNLKAESDWIHINVPGAKTFIVLMQISSSKTPSFTDTYNPANSHIDLFGIDPYPCRTELNGCDFEMIDRFVTAAESWGVPRSRMVPVYQAVGGGGWVDDSGGQYTVPTVSQERQILARWKTLIPRPVFDYAYSWGSQKDDVALENSPDLQKLFSAHNSATRLSK
jgi:hypothetical protein